MSKKNKTMLYSFLAIAILALLFVSFPSISGSTLAITGTINSINLVQNPSVETADPISYNLPAGYVISGTDVNHLVSLDSTTAHIGTKSIHFTVNHSTKSFYSIATPAINVTGGKTYLIEMWVKSSGLSTSTGLWNGTGGYPDRMYMEFREFNSTGQLPSYNSVGYFGCGGNPAYSSMCGTGKSAFDNNINKGWQKISRTYKVQSTATYMTPKLYAYIPNGDVWFDDIRVSELTDDSNVSITNAGFEIWDNTYKDTTLNNNNVEYSLALGWYCGQFGGICEQSTDAQEGSYSFKVTAPTAHNTYLAQDANYLKIGEKYTLSAYIKSADQVFFHAQRTNWSVGGDSGSATYNGGNTWQKISFDFTTTLSNTHRIVFDSISNKAGTNFLVDNVQLKDNGLATACTTNAQCTTSQVCLVNYCSSIACLSGYHAQNNMCIKDPVDCASGSSYDAKTQSCVVNPVSAISQKLMIQIALVLIIGVLIFFIYRRK